MSGKDWFWVIVFSFLLLAFFTGIAKLSFDLEREHHACEARGGIPYTAQGGPNDGDDFCFPKAMTKYNIKVR